MVTNELCFYQSCEVIKRKHYEFYLSGVLYLFRSVFQLDCFPPLFDRWTLDMV